MANEEKPEKTLNLQIAKTEKRDQKSFYREEENMSKDRTDVSVGGETIILGANRVENKFDGSVEYEGAFIQNGIDKLIVDFFVQKVTIFLMSVVATIRKTSMTTILDKKTANVLALVLCLLQGQRVDGLTCNCDFIDCPKPEIKQTLMPYQTKGGMSSVKGEISSSICQLVPDGPCGCCKTCAANLGAVCGGNNPRCRDGLVCKPNDPLYIMPAGYDPPGVCVQNDVPRCETSNSPKFPRLWLPVYHWRMSHDACTLCWCTKNGGMAKCLTQKCKPRNHPCMREIRCPGICCPICLD